MPYSDIRQAAITIAQLIPGIPADHVYGQQMPSVNTPQVEVEVSKWSILKFVPGYVRDIKYELTVRVLLRYTNPVETEQQLSNLLNAAIDTFDAHKRLGWPLTVNQADMTDGAASFATINGTVYRVAEFNLTVLERTAFRNA